MTSEALPESRIILKCVKDKNKLRIRFHCFIDDSGNQHYNVYNNEYNCMFPRDIRENGCYYQVGIYDVELKDDGKKKPFYNIKQTNIIILGFNSNLPSITNDNSDIKIFDIGEDGIGECVICLSEISSIIFTPCAHRCSCSDCYTHLKKSSNKCPLCRRIILSVI
jgi:hypothetical protein